ncbi:MAG: transposase, partial [Lachnospiraceae bacterium]|nr:transposase [Lachnospiraceae bacterium]
SAMTSDNRFEEVIEEVHEKEAKYMCEVIDIMLSKGWQEAIDSGMQQGMQKGLEEGMQKGLEEGRQEGIVTGVELEKKNIAQSMKKKGFDISLIMELTGLTKEKILSL